MKRLSAMLIFAATILLIWAMRTPAPLPVGGMAPAQQASLEDRMAAVETSVAILSERVASLEAGTILAPVPTATVATATVTPTLPTTPTEVALVACAVND